MVFCGASTGAALREFQEETSLSPRLRAMRCLIGVKAPAARHAQGEDRAASGRTPAE